MNSRAQGTIEYLVILSIVIVIGLAVVGLSTNILSSNSTQVGNTTGKIAGKVGVGGISIIESVTDPRGDGIISLSNNSGGNITLTKITPIDSKGNAGTASNFNTTLTQGTSRTFSLSDINTACPCNTGDTTKTCTFRFTITTDAGLAQELTTSVTTNCTTDTIPTNPGGVVGLGSGTLTDPWIINSCTELQNMNQRLDGNYALGVDIPCSETSNWNSGAGFIPVGNSTPGYYFTGSFNGGGKTISNLMINRTPSYTGLFGYATGTISNIGLIDINVIGSSSVGSLAGYQSSGTITNSYSTGNITGINDVGGLVGISIGTITNSYSTGNITGTTAIGGLAGESVGTITNSYSTGTVTSSSDYIGGLVGISYGTISNSYSTGTVTGSIYVGSLVGKQNSGTITNSHSTGNVNGFSSVGGLVAYQSSGTITNSYSIGTVTGFNNVGGLVGASRGTITNSYSTGNVNGFGSVGGLVGLQPVGTISNSYSTGNVTGNNADVGGLVGWQYGTITNSYSTGIVTGVSNVGGLVGQQSSGTITNSYWDKTTSGKTVMCGLVGGAGCTDANGMTTAQMKQQSTFSGWDFATIWNIIEATSYPYLR